MSSYRSRANFSRGGRGGAWRGGSSSPKGAFVNGVWHCDCEPPLPAVHLQVKKEGPNKGRWFRICQKPQGSEERCKFFLWDSEAHPRENAALANNTRTEPGRVATTTPRAQRVASPPPPYTPEPRLAESRNHHQEEDEFDLGAPSQDEIDRVMAIVDTPSKRPRTEADAFATPSRPKRRKLPWHADNTPVENTLLTPRTSSSHTFSTRPSAPGASLLTPQTASNNAFSARLSAPGDSLITPSRHQSSNDPQPMTPTSSQNETPTPARFKNVSESDLARDVFGVLGEANVQMSEQARKNLTTVLLKHVTMAEGVKKGRDVARASITAKTAKVTELTYRVNTLEAELEAEKAKVNHLEWSLEHGQQSD